jgi:hypothetical protein
MIRITLTSEQANQLSGISELVEMLDEQGNRIGIVVPELNAEIETALSRRDSKNRRYTTDEVLAHLRAVTPS